jgi:hypothetical protein
MRTDKQLRNRLAEIRTQRKEGTLTPEQAVALREDAFAARKAAREEFTWQGQRAMPTLPKVWTGEPAAAINPGKTLFFQCLRVLVNILRSPARDPETGLPRIRKMPKKGKADAAKRGPSKGWRGGARLPADHHVLFALMPKRPPKGIKVPALVTPVEIALTFGVHAIKREVFNPARAEVPMVAATKRAEALAASGWLVGILRTPESDNPEVLEARAATAERLHEAKLAGELRKRADKGGNTPKSGWGPKDQTFTWHDGRIMRPEERALFGIHDNASGHRAKRADVKEWEDMSYLREMCKQLREGGRTCESEIDLPLPEPEGLVSYTVTLSGPLQVGEDAEGTPQWVHEVTTKQSPCSDIKGEDGKAIPGSGAKLRAQDIALHHSVGKNGINVARTVTYTCPATDEKRTVSRTECLSDVDPDRDMPDNFGDLSDSEQGDVREARHSALAKGEIQPRKRYATHWTRNTNTSGPWQKCKDSFKGGTYDRMCRAQGL